MSRPMITDKTPILHRLLTDAQAQLLREERQTLADIRLALADLDLPRQDLDTLQQATLQLDELFLLVVVGEFNAGKSALVNALLGERVLPEGVTPTTSKVTLVKWGDRINAQAAGDDLALVTYPLGLLKEINIVDTPGTNAVIRHHERLTSDFVPRSDLVLFVTSADRPMTESERQFLATIRAWDKKVVMILNKVDILQNEAELAEVQTFVQRYADQVLGSSPEFYAVSARLAEQSYTERSPEKSAQLRAASRVDALAHYIETTLDDAARWRLKLASPLGVAAHVVEQAQSAAQTQAEELNADKETAIAVEAVISGYEHDLGSELDPRLAEIDNILFRMQERGLDFFDRTLRLTNIAALARGDKIRAEFERQVLADVSQQIEGKVQRVIDWLVDKDLRQWQLVMDYMQKRQARYADSLIGEHITPLDNRRRTLIDSVGQSAKTIVETYDRDQEAHDLAVNVESSVAQVALLEVGAVGLGTLVTTVIASSALDFTGILAASTLAIVGLFIIPYKRNQAKTRFRDKTQTLRERLLQALETQFNSEASNSVTRMKEAVAPYTRFVRAERERIEQSQARLAQLRDRISAVQARIGS
ncbi:MAG: dynamin family protein [Chloroflexi bacterium]|nr:dynamin family protein [Chloroflexota bacterium]